MILLLLNQVAKPAIPVPVTDTSGHRHKNSAGKWVTVIDGKHRHADVDARLKALETAVAKLLAR